MRREAAERNRIARMTGEAHALTVPRLSRAVLCLLVVLGVGASATSWDDRDEGTARQDVIALVTAAPARAPIAIVESPAAIPRAPAIPARIEPAIVAPAPTQPLLSLAPKTSPPRC